MGNLFEDVVFCPGCDYALSKLERALLRAPLHKVSCPRCLCTNVADFYSYGSLTHRVRREAWERGEFAGSPPPLPPAKTTSAVR